MQTDSRCSNKTSEKSLWTLFFSLQLLCRGSDGHVQALAYPKITIQSRDHHVPSHTHTREVLKTCYRCKDCASFHLAESGTNGLRWARDAQTVYCTSFKSRFKDSIAVSDLCPSQPFQYIVLSKSRRWGIVWICGCFEKTFVQQYGRMHNIVNAEVSSRSEQMSPQLRLGNFRGRTTAAEESTWW